jgi:internalin A
MKRFVLLMTGLLVASAIYCYSAEPKPKQAKPDEQEKAIAEIKKLGGVVEVDEKSPDKPVITVYLGARKVIDADLVHLKALTTLRELILACTEITDDELVHLKGLTNLDRLDLGYTKVGDAGLAHLKGLTNLRILLLDDTKVTDAGLKHLKGLAKLRELCVVHTDVTAAGVEDLRKALPNCDIND